MASANLIANIILLSHAQKTHYVNHVVVTKIVISLLYFPIEHRYL